MNASIIDVRGTPHHERPPAIFKKLAGIKDGETLTLKVEVEPLPMYQVLKSRGYRAEGKMMGGTWVVSIEKEGNE